MEINVLFQVISEDKMCLVTYKYENNNEKN